MTLERMNLRKQALNELVQGFRQGMNLVEASEKSIAYNQLSEEERDLVFEVALKEVAGKNSAPEVYYDAVYGQEQI